MLSSISLYKPVAGVVNTSGINTTLSPIWNVLPSALTVDSSISVSLFTKVPSATTVKALISVDTS